MEPDRQSDLRRQYFAQAIHEMRNPIAVINGVSTLLKQENAGDQVVELSTILQKEVDLLNRLLTDLSATLFASVIKSNISLKQIDFSQVVLSAVSSLEILYPHRELIVMGVGEPLPILGDFSRLEEVVRNIVGNATKYSPPDTPISLSVTRPKSGAVIRLVVSDRGIGIPREQVKLVFDPFFRASNGLAQNQSGLGLGLFICKDIVEIHHGRIWLESSPAIGTSVFIELPVYTAD